MFKGIKKFTKSFACAGKGIFAIIISERNMRIHVLAALTAIALGAHYSIKAIEWCLIALCIGMVMAAEAFNSAIEHLTDLAKPEFNPEAGKIKDIAAGAVLLVSLA